MSGHRCKCCGGAPPCGPSGPCCDTAPVVGGKCFPRTYVSDGMGGWTGTPLPSVSGSVRAYGTAKMVRQRRTIGGLIERVTDFVYDSFTDAQAIEMTGVGDSGPCRAFAGEVELYDDPEQSLYNLTCPVDVGIVEPVPQVLDVEIEYDPAAGIVTPFKPSGGALARYQITVGVYVMRLKFDVTVWRSPSLSAGAPATVQVLASIVPDVGTGFEYPLEYVAVGVALNPCGTRIRLTASKIEFSAPAAVTPGGCPLPSPSPSDACRLCVGWGFGVTVELNLGDGFSACQPCVPQAIPDSCCGRDGLDGEDVDFLPVRAGASTWLDTAAAIDFTRTVTECHDADPPETVLVSTTETINWRGVIEWSTGCPQSYQLLTIGTRVQTFSDDSEVTTPFDVVVYARISGEVGGVEDVMGFGYAGGPDIVILEGDFLAATVSSDIATGGTFTPGLLNGATRRVTGSFSASASCSPQPGTTDDTWTGTMVVGPLTPCVYDAGGPGGGDSLLLMRGEGIEASRHQGIEVDARTRLVIGPEALNPALLHGGEGISAARAHEVGAGGAGAVPPQQKNPCCGREIAGGGEEGRDVG